jgi:PadR family transcriptional regulator, regulatory protein PadR
MCGMRSDPGLTELRRGVLGPCVLALLDERPRFGLELVRELAAAGGLLTSDGTVYPLLSRLRDAGLVTSEWHDPAGERARRYYFITDDGRAQLKAFRADWTDFAATVSAVLFPSPGPPTDRTTGPAGGGSGNGQSVASGGSAAGGAPQ